MFMQPTGLRRIMNQWRHMGAGKQELTDGANDEWNASTMTLRSNNGPR